jgi:hypothetical protein
MSSEPEPNVSDAEEMQLCISCTAPNNPSAHFCAKCGAPLTSYASTGPFESIFAEGSVYRSAVERPQKLVVVLGIWLLFGPVTLGGVMIASFSDESFMIRVMGIGLAAISIAMLWKTTRNYLARKKPDAMMPDNHQPTE